MGNMKRRIRKRRILKWIGFVLCGAIGILWALSLSTRIRYSGGDTWYVRTHPGGILVERYTFSEAQGWEYGDYCSESYRHVWWPFRGRTSSQTEYLGCPFWLTLMPTAIVTLLLCRFDQRNQSGCMNCGYNLTGNVSGVCPECGTSTDAKLEDASSAL